MRERLQNAGSRPRVGKKSPADAAHEAIMLDAQSRHRRIGAELRRRRGWRHQQPPKQQHCLLLAACNPLLHLHCCHQLLQGPILRVSSTLVCMMQMMSRSCNTCKITCACPPLTDGVHGLRQECQIALQVCRKNMDSCCKYVMHTCTMVGWLCATAPLRPLRASAAAWTAAAAAPALPSRVSCRTRLGTAPVPEQTKYSGHCRPGPPTRT